MLRTHTSPARGLALGLAAVVALSSPVALAAPATASAGDENLPATEDPDAKARPRIPPPTNTPATPQPAAASTSTPAPTTAVKRVNKGTLEQGLELSDQADAKFDAGDYPEAARLYNRTLQLLGENDSNHVTRSIVLVNGVTAYEHIYATSGEVDPLRSAQLMLQDYLKACKTKWGVGCERYPETQEARARLKSVLATIDRAVPVRPKIPPEIDSAPGGKSYDLTVSQPPPPAWIAPAYVAGVLLAGGGSLLIVHGATSDKFGPLVSRSLLEDADGDGVEDTTDDTTDTSGSSSTSSTTYELPPAAKGKLLIALGTFLVAAGVGTILLSSLRLAKHRRINKSRSQQLALVPSFGRSSAGLVLSGRF